MVRIMVIGAEGEWVKIVEEELRVRRNWGRGVEELDVWIVGLELWESWDGSWMVERVVVDPLEALLSALTGRVSEHVDPDVVQSSKFSVIVGNWGSSIGAGSFPSTAADTFSFDLQFSEENSSAIRSLGGDAGATSTSRLTPFFFSPS